MLNKLCLISKQLNHLKQKIYIFCLSEIYPAIKGINLKNAVKKHEFLLNLILANSDFKESNNIDLVIELKFCRKYITGDINENKNCDLVALNLFFVGSSAELLNVKAKYTKCYLILH